MKRLFCIIFIILFFTLPCYGGINAKREVKKGNILYNKGKFDESLKNYNNALTSKPESDIVNFDLGTALYKTKDYEKALEHFNRSLTTNDPKLEQKANYNLANTEYKFGKSKESSNLPEAVGLLEGALRHYEKALTLNPDDNDAKYNYEVVKKEVEPLKEKLKQQGWGKGGQENKEKVSEEDKKVSERENAEKQNEQILKEQKETKEPQINKILEEDKGNDKEYMKEEGSKEKVPQESKDGEEEFAEDKDAKDKVIKKMLKKEAVMLLEDYRQEEEPKSLYKEKMQIPNERDVAKDW